MDQDSLSFFCPSYSILEAKEIPSLPLLAIDKNEKYPFSLSLLLQNLDLSFWICIIQDLLSASVCLFHFLSWAGVCENKEHDSQVRKRWMLEERETTE